MFNRKNKAKWYSRWPLEFEFNVFYNQLCPPAYYESRKTVLRHLEEINKILYDMKDQVWTYRKVRDQRYEKKERLSVSCDKLTDNLYEKIINEKLKLPTYQEIEEEKMRWQKTPVYNKDQGTSQPIEEEVVQLKIHKK